MANVCHLQDSISYTWCADPTGLLSGWIATAIVEFTRFQPHHLLCVKTTGCYRHFVFFKLVKVLPLRCFWWWLMKWSGWCVSNHHKGACSSLIYALSSRDSFIIWATVKTHLPASEKKWGIGYKLTGGVSVDSQHKQLMGQGQRGDGGQFQWDPSSIQWCCSVSSMSSGNGRLIDGEWQCRQSEKLACWHLYGLVHFGVKVW